MPNPFNHGFLTFDEDDEVENPETARLIDTATAIIAVGEDAGVSSIEVVDTVIVGGLVSGRTIRVNF